MLVEGLLENALPEDVAEKVRTDGRPPGGGGLSSAGRSAADRQSRVAGRQRGGPGGSPEGIDARGRGAPPTRRVTERDATCRHLG